MKAYLVYTYDTSPYSDVPNHPHKVFFNEQKAIEYVQEKNLNADQEKESWQSTPLELFDYSEIELIV